jgi:predicted ATPase/class 3 adenylate cyclase
MTNIPEGGELREATVLFCDLGGYTAWNEEEEPEKVVAVMDHIKLQAIRIFEEHGGIANQFIGDEILGLFGVISSHEDDCCRAISAALELHAYVHNQQVMRADGSRRVLELHTGIETGSVYVRVTDSRAGLFDVTGDTVNTAARLRALAAAGKVLIGPATYDSASSLFELTALEPVQVRGKAQPVTPFLVNGRTRTSGSWSSDYSRRAQTEFVGRADELWRLGEHWARARAGTAALVTVEGPAGIGKSRLCHELRKCVEAPDAPPALVLHGRCSAYRAAAYEPLIEVARGLFEAEDPAALVLPARFALAEPLSEASRQALCALIAPDECPAAQTELSGEKLRVAIGDALSELVLSLATMLPVLIVLEDFHDADEPSRAAVERILQAVAGRRVLFVVNFRPSESVSSLRAHAVEHVALKPLDGEHTRTLTCGVLTANSVAPELADYIHERTLGNPFFVEEICRSLVEGGAITRRFGYVVATRRLETSRAPRSVLSIVRVRIERLTASHKKLLRLASVLGLEFDVEALEMLWTSPKPAQSALVSESTWRSLHPPEDSASIPGLLLELEHQGLVLRVSTDRHRFRHAITQEVVYDSLPRHERRWYHGLVASWTERARGADVATAHYETLAYHYGLSANLPKAIDYAILSGDKAWLAFSLEQASAQYGTAIALLDSLGALDAEQQQRYIAVSVSWARVGLYNPHAKQLAALQIALDHARALRDARRECVCLNWTSWIEYGLGNQADAVASSAAFLRAASALGDAGLAAQALTNSGLAHVLSTEYQRAVELIQAGIEKRGRSDGTAYAYSLGYLALIRGDQGHFEQAEDYLSEAWQLVEAEGREALQGPALIQRGMVQAWRGEWTSCRETAGRALAVASRIGAPYIRALSLVLHGYALGMQSDAERARGIELLQQGITTLEGLGIRLHLSWCLSGLAELLLLMGDGDRASEVARLALARAAENDRLGESAARRVLAMTALELRSDAEEATRQLMAALEAARNKASPRDEALAELGLAHVHHQTGDREAARVWSARASRFLALHGMLHWQGRALELLEALG